MMRAAMASDEAHGEHHGPHPVLPPVHDEAADTPLWVPITGIALFVLLGFFVALRGAMGEGDGAEADGSAPAAEAPEGEAPEGEAAAE